MVVTSSPPLLIGAIRNFSDYQECDSIDSCLKKAAEYPHLYGKFVPPALVMRKLYKTLEYRLRPYLHRSVETEIMSPVYSILYALYEVYKQKHNIINESLEIINGFMKSNELNTVLEQTAIHLYGQVDKFGIGKKGYVGLLEKYIDQYHKSRGLKKKLYGLLVEYGIALVMLHVISHHNRTGLRISKGQAEFIRKFFEESIVDYITTILREEGYNIPRRQIKYLFNKFNLKISIKDIANENKIPNYMVKKLNYMRNMIEYLYRNIKYFT